MSWARHSMAGFTARPTPKAPFMIKMLLRRAALAAVLLLTCAPPALAAGGLGPITTSTPASSLVLCTTACDVLDFHATASVVGYLIVLDTPTVPATGPLTGRVIACIYIAQAPGTGSYSTAGMPPTRVLTGLVMLYSTTGCRAYTPTSSADMFGRVQ